jgi:hypothetical protein
MSRVVGLGQGARGDAKNLESLTARACDKAEARISSDKL